MSNYGHYQYQYYSKKNMFPIESFLIDGISHYQKNLININYDSKIIMCLDINNKYDKQAIEILYNSNTIGYVPNTEIIKKLCLENINTNLKIINIKKDNESNNFGIRVIPEKYFNDDLICIF